MGCYDSWWCFSRRYECGVCLSFVHREGTCRQVRKAILFDRSQTGDEHPYLSYSVVIDEFECELTVLTS